MSADNQQESLKTVGWIVGFVDGEGCFSVTLQKMSSMKTGWQVFPEFVVTQGKSSLSALRDLQDHFGCGRIFLNRRVDNHREHLYRFCVRSLGDLQQKVIPFFQQNALRTKKREDFAKFVRIIEMMEKKRHLGEQGLEEIARIVQTMNRRKSARFLESSETVRPISA
ncbi:MAG: LAGLIDADG family homing endonuclease [Deltaproteobacteria bacterium]|nr:LAGLIDADG family homing endonuclease [Deltaproteobacteria bacterium]